MNGSDKPVSDERLRDALANPPGPRHAAIRSDADERLAPIYRCKRVNAEGGISDGCGWQGTNIDKCPSCGSDVLRLASSHTLALATLGLAGDAAARKAAPIASGVLFYFPNALAAVANLSKVGNEQHNPGQPMHWAFDKSSDEADCITRHLAQSGTLDTDGVPHSAKVAWRALAMLERELLAAHPEMQPGKSVKNFKREP